MVEDLSYQNIEFGAGCGNFGQKYYAQCFITDIHDGSKCEINYIDFVHNCMQTPLPSWHNRFELVIMCNPHGYGFNDDEMGYELLNNLALILKNEGKVLIIGNDTNRYCRRTTIQKRVQEFNVRYSHLQFEYSGFDFDARQEYPNHTFYQSNHLNQCRPNHKTELCIKK